MIRCNLIILVVIQYIFTSYAHLLFPGIAIREAQCTEVCRYFLYTYQIYS